MAQHTVGECGQVTLPPEFLQAADIEAGDFVLYKVTGPNTIELTLLPRLTLEEMFEKYRIDGSIDFAADREAMYDELAEEFFQKIAVQVAEADNRGGETRDDLSGSERSQVAITVSSPPAR